MHNFLIFCPNGATCRRNNTSSKISPTLPPLPELVFVMQEREHVSKFILSILMMNQLSNNLEQLEEAH
jgi:hypothetical protein